MTHLDKSCLNVLLHRQHDLNRHAVDGRDAFAGQIKWQPDQNVDDYCEPLGKQGARRALFKITLASHGYGYKHYSTQSNRSARAQPY